MPASGPGEIEFVATEGGARLCVRGEWTLAHHATLAARVRALSAQAVDVALGPPATASEPRGSRSCCWVTASWGTSVVLRRG